MSSAPNASRRGRSNTPKVITSAGNDNFAPSKKSDRPVKRLGSREDLSSDARFTPLERFCYGFGFAN